MILNISVELVAIVSGYEVLIPKLVYEKILKLKSFASSFELLLLAQGGAGIEGLEL